MTFQTSDSIETVEQKMRSMGASRVFFKLLSNNDNSKNQIYLGRDFDVLRVLPHGELKPGGITKKGATFKATIELSWLTNLQSGALVSAPNSQLILYPQYPEVRLSGFLLGCCGAPNNLLRAPSREERLKREENPRCLILGACPDGLVIAYIAAWESSISFDAITRVNQRQASTTAGIFYELQPSANQNKQLLLNRLREIAQLGPVSSRLQVGNDNKQYNAENGAGYTLESLFEITPNGRSEPDYLDWELKCHSRGAVTLMTPEPDQGLYLENLDKFFESHGSCTPERWDFNGRHTNDKRSEKSGLTFKMQGYDPIQRKLLDPNGSLVLLNDLGEVAAGWSFAKLLTHWAKKHAQTAYISYSKVGSEDDSGNFYQFGPSVLMCQGADPVRFLAALHEGIIYYDPGINRKLDPITLKWKQKKRSQFRVAFKNIGLLYSDTKIVDIL